MSSSLYNEAIEAAEQIKLSAENKVKEQIIESISPQIRAMVEKKLFEEEVKEEEECGYETVDEAEKVDEYGCGEELEEGEENQSPEVELNAESRRVLSKLINNNAKRNAVIKKISELREGIATLQKAIILSENTGSGSKTSKKIASLYKKLINEIENLKTNSIIKNDTDLLKEFYTLNKELTNMSSRRRNRRYLNESLDELLEMDLFEADEEEEDAEDTEEAAGDDAADELDLPDLPDEDDQEGEEEDDDLSGKSAAEIAAELESLAVDVRGLGAEEAPTEDEDEPELDLEGLFEADLDEEMHHDEDLDEADEDPNKEEQHEIMGASAANESRQSRNDVILEIDENMLKREISKMKSLREGDAKAVASHFGGGSVEGEAFVDGVELNKLHEMKMQAAKVIRKNRMLERKLAQHKKALRQMKGQLSEMNLFNAKLLYANKLMQNKDLSMKQQKSIVESLDEAQTLNEAKILFESLSKSLTRKTKARSNRRLSEGALRKPRGTSSQPVRSAQTLNESVALDRWATLAGIKH